MGIRDTSYYGWQNILTHGPNANNNLVSASLNGMTIDSSGAIYVAGSEARGIYNQGSGQVVGFSGSILVFKSTDNGKHWSIVLNSGTTSSVESVGLCIAVDRNDILYMGGSVRSVGGAGNTRVIKRSTDRGITWSNVYDVAASVGDGIGSIVFDSSSIGIAVTSQPKPFIDGPSSVVVLTSSNNGQQWTVVQNLSGSAGENMPGRHTLTIHTGSNKAYVTDNKCSKLRFTTDGGTSWSSSSVRFTGTFGYDPSGDTGALCFMGITTLNDGKVYVAASQTGSGINPIGHGPALLLTSSNGGLNGGLSASEGDKTYFYVDVAADSKDNIYILGAYNNTTLYLKKTNNGLGFTTIDTISSCSVGKLFIDKRNDDIYIMASDRASVHWGGLGAFLRRGRLTANSASLGPSMLATSLGYVQGERSGSLTERFTLNNVSEFPHAGGVFQMKNIILGTRDSGKIGKDEDAIIRVNYIGSVVKVLWPKQADQSIPVKGFGDMSLGQRVGKLSNIFEPGDEIDVTDYDHLALYCYLKKEVSGTLDDIEIKIERRPLKSTGYATEQAVEYQSSGSYTVAKLTDIIYKKQINYGDLSIREVGFPLDVPLTNIKEVRLSARHINGQVEENKNFIIWGRLIKSSKDTNET